MAYDPKKKRPKPKAKDSVVDELFGNEKSASKKAAAKKATAKPAAKTTSQAKATAAKKPAASSKKKTTTSAKATTATPKASEKQTAEKEHDNVTQLYPENDQTPLIMQPQVWVSAAVAVVLVLFIAKRRKKR